MLVTRTDIAPRIARAATVVATAALLGTAFARGLGHLGTGTGVAVVLLTLLVFLLQLRYVTPRAAHLRTLPVWAVQAAACYAAVAPLGSSVGMLCVLAGAALLDRRPALALAVVGSAGGIDAARGAPARDAVDMTLTVVLGGIVVHGVTRLATVVDEVYAARLTLAMAAVADERLRIAAELDEGLSDGLAAVHRAANDGDTAAVLAVARTSLASARAVAADFRSLSLAPEAASARALLASAGIAADVRIGHREPLGPTGALLATVLREAVTDVVRQGTARTCLIETTERDGRVVVRVSHDGAATADRGAGALDDLAARVTAAGATFITELGDDGRFTVEASAVGTREPDTDHRPDPEYRLTLLVFACLLAAFCVKALLYCPPVLYVAAVPCIAVLCALQWHFSVNDASRRGRLGLALHAVIALVPLAWFGREWIGVPGFLAGSLLMALPPLAAWPLVAVTMLVGGLAQGVNAGFSILVTGLILYAFLTLARLVRELHAAGAELARAAAVRERLRAARDLHDLLGHSLAAVVLKAELALRLRPVDPERADAELADIAGMAGRAAADLRTVSGEASQLTFATELASAVSVLTAAGIQVEAETPEPPEADEVLGVVLREAVTNMLRHSTAKHCRIALAVTPDGQRLDVENDGVAGDVTPPGAGLGNLTVRLAEAGGTLAAGPDDGWFVLRAELDTGPSPRAARTEVTPRPDLRAAEPA